MMNNFDIDEFWSRQKFREQLSNYRLWLYKASELIRVANILNKQIDEDWANARNSSNIDKPEFTTYPMIQDIQFMLYSYALENYFKAIIIFKNPDICNADRIPSKINTHCLVNLAKDVEFNLNADETNLLLRLERNAEWQGRYPVPIKYNKTKNVIKYAGETHFLAFFSSEDRIVIQNILERIYEFIKVTINDNNAKCN